MVDNTLNEEEQSEELEPTPYQNTYRRDLEEPTFNEEEEADNIDDPVEATRQQLAQHEGLASSKKNGEQTHDFKKRYDDLKRHYDNKLNEWKQEKELLGAKLSVEAKKHDIQELPKTEEELSEFKEKYPDVYDVVETISTLQANERVREIEDKLDGLRVKEQEAVVQTAAKQLLNMHPDFEVLKESDVFLSWLDEQPSNISDGIYKNNIDVQWAARVIDLFKVDNGIKIPKARNKSKSTKGPQSSQRKNDAAQAVTKTNTKRSLDQFQDDKKVWSIQEISKLKPWEYEKVEKDIDKAVKEGRVVDSVE
jgi:hypothetical protein|tara:strand:- start:9370 stop:10293 length:924 start_codon:yes stop_codon:yes gene_type:complete